MTRKQALTDLLAKVEAGDIPDTALVQRAFGHADKKFKGFRIGELIHWVMQADDIRAMGAAKALHEAVLPGWIVHRIGQRYNGVWEVNLMQLGADKWHDPDVNKRVNAWCDEEARTRLIAIIKALIAEETQ